MPNAITDDYDIDEEIEAAKNLVGYRGVPAKNPDNLLVMTWNIEYLGSRKRTPDDYRLIAELMRPFDIIAIQEVKTKLAGINALVENLGDPYKAIFTDVAGNSERLAYIYDSSRVRTKELFAELAIPEKKRKKYDPPDIPSKFSGFNRNPFLVCFQREEFDFTLANVHIYFGKRSRAEKLKRIVEVYALSKWASDQARSRNVYDKDIILIGDMNVPMMKESDEVFKQLTRFGYEPTDWSSKVGTDLKGTKHYDQIAIHPKRTRKPSHYGILNFDKHLFKSVWDRHNLDPENKEHLKRWRHYCEMHISDHRPLWVSFDV